MPSFSAAHFSSSERTAASLSPAGIPACGVTPNRPSVATARYTVTPSAAYLASTGPTVASSSGCAKTASSDRTVAVFWTDCVTGVVFCAATPDVTSTRAHKVCNTAARRMSLTSGSRIGPYEIVAPLGAGGMGEVYRARDGREVAIKVLPASFALDEDRLRRFEQEARAIGALNHPNILGVYDIGSHEGAPYVVSELLEGETLRARIGTSPLPHRKALDYASQMARGLAAAHDRGIVHRDLKPDNVFITRDGRVKILDFGLAKLTQTAPALEAETALLGHAVPLRNAGTVRGTVVCMSPEQVRGQAVDQRSDIFSFGIGLYEMLTGRRAFHGDSAVETMNAILKEDPAAAGEQGPPLPPALD